MRIDHVALWTQDLERLRSFYERHFGATAGPKYENQEKQFSSYFLSFTSAARLEIMQRVDVSEASSGERIGYAHLAFVVGSEADVDRFTQRLQDDGVPLVDGPRRTGDGYYESVVLDPDGNRIEIAAG